MAEAKTKKVATKKKVKLPQIATQAKIKKITPEEREKIEAAEDKVASKHNFKDRDAVIITGIAGTKFKLNPAVEYKQNGFTAKKLINKGAAKFVKVIKVKKAD